MEPKRRKVPENLSRRQCTVTYHMPLHDKTERVCQKTLCDTLKVTPRRLNILVHKLKNNETLYDKRGIHKNRPHAIKDQVREDIREHISSFPKQESHYSRGKIQKECLSSDLNITIMYNLFKDKYPNNNNVSLRTYSAVFHDDFKLRFGLPRSDTCAYCDKMYIKLCAADSDEEVNKITNEVTIHHMKAEQGYSSLRDDKTAAETDHNLVVLCTDLEQVLFSPNLKHSNVFYQRQYSCYNYAVHDVATENASMMFWHETIGHRGATEIASCFLKYITDNFQPLRQGEARRLIVWSDRCIGQNNNWCMIAMFHLLITSKYFTQVDQKFMTSGHSFLPCDRDFAQIERCKKSATINVPFDWVEVIVKARNSRPFSVTCMQLEDFKDFSAVSKCLRRDPELKITDVMWIQLTADDPTSIRARKSHNILQPWRVYSLRKEEKHRNRNVSYAAGVHSLKSVYHTLLPIKKEKKNDLLHMCDFLPLEYRQFYENLPCTEV